MIVFNEDGKKDNVSIFFFIGLMKNILDNKNIAII